MRAVPEIGSRGFPENSRRSLFRRDGGYSRQGWQLERDRTSHGLALPHVDRAVVEVGVSRDGVEVRRVCLPIAAHDHGVCVGVLVLRAAGQGLDLEEEADEPLAVSR